MAKQETNTFDLGYGVSIGYINFEASAFEDTIDHEVIGCQGDIAETGGDCCDERQERITLPTLDCARLAGKYIFDVDATAYSDFDHDSERILTADLDHRYQELSIDPYRPLSYQRFFI